MASHVSAIERLQERPITVEPAAIEDEFARIWRETSGAGYDESSVRLRVLNFVAIADSTRAGTDTGAERFDAVMQRLPRHHPCRAILAATVDARSGVEAMISARCIYERRAPEVCCEEVRLTAGPAQGRELASAVLALLVPEIPVAAWLMDGVDMQSYVAAEVLESADTLLADSGAREPGPALREQMAAEREHDARVFDLAWGRTETWRELTAQFFDGEERLRELATIQSIEIRGHRGRSSSEAMLLAGWLVSRLGFSLADLDGDDETIRATLYDGTRGVTLNIGRGWTPELMTMICITTARAEFELQAHELSRHIHVVERWRGSPEGEESRRTVEAPAVDDASLVMLGLDPAPDPRIYREASMAALALLGE
jgi:glucose-6-phosphate dehydrogenase assembly protein OpcA